MPNIIIKNEYGEDELYEGVNTVRFLNEEGSVVSYKYNTGETYSRPDANQHRVRFIDYDGFVLREVYVDSGDAAPSIENPTRDGYVFTGWNQSAETLSSITRNIDVGAMYVAEGVSTEATNGASTFNIKLKTRDSKSVTLYIYSLGSNEFLIDWGDGKTDTITATSTTYYYKGHTYAASGEYTITVTRTAGNSEYHFGQYAAGSSNTSTGVLGSTNTIVVSAVLSSDIKTIASGTFFNYHAVRLVVIPDSVTRIDDAFRQAYQLEQLIYPEGVTNVVTSGFYTNYSLREVVLPSSTVSVGASAFYSCYSLRDLFIYASTPPTCGSSMFTNANTLVIHVPVGSEDAYKSASGWSSWKSYIVGDL